MPIRRINSTGRKKILREDAGIVLRSDPDGVLTFDARLDLADYELPADASVFVEAYRQTLFMRFPHGTVGSPQSPPGTLRRLTEFATRDGLLFRVKVTSAAGRAGILLAEADKIPVRDEDEQLDRRLALLPPVPADLGQEVWRVEFSEGTGPQLCINQDIGDWKALASSPEFRTMVFPQAMREVLMHAVFIHESRDMDDQEDWGGQWLSFASALPGVGLLPDNAANQIEWVEWINTAVAAFCRVHRMFDAFSAQWRAEEPQ